MRTLILTGMLCFLSLRLMAQEEILMCFPPSPYPPVINLDTLKQQMVYPQTAYDAGITGRLVYRVLMDEQGHYVKHKVIKRGHPLLHEVVDPCVEEVKTALWIQGGKPVKCWINITFDMYPAE